jgi:hypothetical protein
VPVLFFNAGDKIEEVLPYSIPTGQDVHCIARWRMLAPKEDFFEVPTELEVVQTNDTIAVQFARDITTKFGSRGVVRVKPDYNAALEDPEKGIEHYPYATSKDGAIARGQELWEGYLRRIVQSHLNDCEAARAAGGAPRSAMGFTKRALKMLNVRDPGEEYFQSLRKGEAVDKGGNPALAALQAQNQLIMTMMLAILQGKPVAPEALKKLAETPNAIGVNKSGEVVTSGVMTGEIKKPITHEDVTPKAVAQPRGKGDRAKDAEKQF